jgi:nucleotide-binding universal stress UspA family protein
MEHVMEHRVVVGISGTEAAHPAVDWAVGYATASHASLEFVHVVDVAWRATPQAFAEEALLQAEQKLREMVERVRGLHPAVEIHSTALVGDPTRVLAEHAGSDLLVVGNRSVNHSGLRLFTTRAVHIARRAAGSVVVFPDSANVEGRGIVTGVDGSEVSAAALAFAAREADRLGEPLKAVHAWYVPLPWSDRPMSWPAAGEEDEERVVLAEAVAGLRVDYPDLEVTSEVVNARATAALYDAGLGARMLVVGSHGYKGFEKAWLGSTSEELLLAMPCPVAVIRP